MPKKPPYPTTPGQVIYNQQNMGIGSAKGRKNKLFQKPKILPKPVRRTDQKPEGKQTEAQVHQMARKSSQILFRTKTVFPFDLFPDTLTINCNKIDVVNAQFFASTQTTSIPLHDIANVEVQTAPFFATLRIINIRYPMNPVVLSYLKKKEAIKAKNIIDGLLVAVSQGTDVASIEPTKLLKQIEKTGKSTVEP